MLCDFAQSFPQFVGDLFEREAGLSRRFREESITDMWVASLVALRSYGVHVDLAIEAETGADLELWFLTRSLDRGLGFVIQAKRAKCERTSVPPHSCSISGWDHHRFVELDHRGGDNRILGSQARDLVQASTRTGRPVYPLYAFYVPQHVHAASGGSVEGVMLADGHEVRRRIVEGLWKTRRRGTARRRSPATFKRLSELKDLLLPLKSMFCVSPWNTLADIISDAELPAAMLLRLVPDKVEIMNVPGPDAVAESLAKAFRSRRTEDAFFRPLPEVTVDIPADILQLAQREPAIGTPERSSKVSARSRVAFVATRDGA